MLELADRQKRTRREIYTNGSEFEATKDGPKLSSRICLDQNVTEICNVCQPLRLISPQPLEISPKPVHIKLDNINRDFQNTLLPALPVNKAFSWDDVSNHDEPVRSYEPASHSDLQTIVIRNAANVFLGLSTDIVIWNQLMRRFEVCKEIASTRIGSFLSQCSVTGSYLRRLSRAVEDLRATPKDGSTSPSIFSLASAIQHEISMFQIKGKQLYASKTMIEFAKFSLPLSMDIRLLAMLIGCQSLQSPGTLSRIPSAIELLNRAYNKAHNTGSDMFWRIVVACLRPWFDQLNFAIGLKNTRMERTLSSELKKVYFPDIFIGFSGEEGSDAYLMKESIPIFVPKNIANAVLECYVLLSYMKGRGVSIPCEMGLIKLPEEESVISLSHLRMMESYDLPELVIQQPPSSPRPSSQPETHQRSTSSEIPNIIALLAPILIRSRQLDLFVKQEYRDDIEDFLRIITDLYLLHDGRTWSLMCDLLNNYSGRDLVTAVNAIITTEYNIEVVTDHGDMFKLLYEPSEVMASMFGRKLLVDCQAIFTRIIQLQVAGNFQGLAMFTSRIEDIIKSIDMVFRDTNKGVNDLISQVKHISRLPIL